MLRFPPSAAHRVPARPNPLLVLLAAGLLVFLPACGGGAEADGDETRATVPETDATTDEPADDIDRRDDPMTEEEAVEAAYHEATRALFEHMEDPQQPFDDLERTRTGESLAIVQEVLESRRKSGEYSVYPTGYPVGEILSIEVEGDEAGMVVCEPNDVVLTASDGEPVDDSVVAYRLEINLIRANGEWKVSREDGLEKYEGQRTCDA